MNQNLWLHRFSLVTAFSTWFLLFAGAMVTSTGSGLAVPDWPLSFGKFFPPMVGGVFYEHGHRMVAGVVALMTFGLIYLLARYEARPWVRWVGYLSGVAVVVQAVLGGVTVLLRLPPEVSASHATLGQTFFCLTILIAMATSPRWDVPVKPLEGDRVFLWGSVLLCAGFFVQLIIGAYMRHTGAGLAIPDFPTSFGQAVPPFFSAPIAIHFAHRVMAFALAFLVVAWAGRNLVKYSARRGIVALSTGLLATVAVQVLLGASVIWLRRPVVLTSVHLAVGALCLGLSVMAVVVAFRLRGAREWTQPVTAGKPRYA